jgi:hypothetical protein
VTSRRAAGKVLAACAAVHMRRLAHHAPWTFIGCEIRVPGARTDLAPQNLDAEVIIDELQSGASRARYRSNGPFSGGPILTAASNPLTLSTAWLPAQPSAQQGTWAGRSPRPEPAIAVPGVPARRPTSWS